MEIKMLFNGAGINEDFFTGWGLSFLIDNRIIFDTGEKGDALLKNINKMKIDVSLVESLVISHDHWDHTGGMLEILGLQKNMNVYACPGFSNEFKEEVRVNKGVLIDNDSFFEVSKGVYVTGEIQCKYKGKAMPEQAIVINSDKGLSVITGCAHPGIVEILELVKRNFTTKKFYAVFGGFHLMSKDGKDLSSIVKSFRKLGVKKAGPTHCSGTDAENIFKKEYGKDFISTKIGERINV